jgi:ABC-type sugar transport system substrate-binding protein
MMVRVRAGLGVSVLLATAAIAVAACGSSSSSSSATSSTGAATSATGAGSSSATGSFTAPTGSGGLPLIGSAGSQSSEATTPLGIKAQTGAKQQEAMAAADKIVAEVGHGTIPKGTTVGLEEIINSVPSAQRADGQLMYALRELGINTIPCDGEGDPTKMESCMTSLVSQGVKVIFSLATDPSLIAQGLQDAKSHNIPVVPFAGAVGPSPDWFRVYYNDDAYAGQILGKYVVSQISAHGGGSVWISNYPASWAAVRTDGLTAAVKGTNVKIAAQTTVPSTNPIAGTQQQVITQYTQDPNTNGYWFAYDAPGAAGAQALASKDGAKPFPSGPLVVTFHDDQQANGLLRSGQLSAVLDEDYDASSFEAVDAIAQWLAGKTVPPSDTSISTPYEGHQMYSYPVITKSNNPPAGQWPEPAFDVVSFFTWKWHKEFGLG